METQEERSREIPLKYLVDFNQIESGAKTPPQTIVYFLLEDSEIVYVGQSTVGLSRIYQHRDKVFNRYFYINVDYDALDEVEDYYIFMFKPKYNKSLARYGLTSLNVLRNRIKQTGLPPPHFHLPKIKQAIRTLGIETKLYNGLFYVKDSDCKNIFNHLVENFVGGQK